MRKEPPRFAERVVHWMVGGRDADAVVGDLREQSGGGWWYWRQALSCFLVRISPHRRMIPDLRMDLRLALRNIRRNPGYAVVAVLCLGLAMGVNATLFSFLDSVYFRPLPVPDAARVVRVRRERGPVCTWREYMGFRGDLRSMETAAEFNFGGPVDIGHRNLLLGMQAVSANYAHVLRLGTVMGRWFRPEDDSADAENAVVLSYKLWKTQLDSDPAVLGKVIQMEELPFRIIGVAPESFTGDLPPVNMDAWVSLGAMTATYPGDPKVNLVARLTPAATLANAAAEIRVLDARLGTRANPALVQSTAGFAGSGRTRYLESVLPASSVVCGMLLLIACVNVANLLLSRAAVRRREIAVRQALGAGRGRIFQEALTEGMVLAAGSVLAGTVLMYWSGRILERVLPDSPIYFFHGVIFAINWRVALLLGGVGAITAIFFSLPAAIESSKCGVNVALKGEGMRRSRQREIYSLAQVALSLALLIATGLGLRTLERVESADPGFATDRRLAVNVAAPAKAYPPAQRTALYTSLLEEARRLPGVVEATIASGPLGPAPGECASPSLNDMRKRVPRNIVEPNYFRMMGVPIVAGRALAEGGALADPPAVVATETLAKSWWPGESALGKPVWIGCDAASRVRGEVVGVARDTRPSLDASPYAAYYVSRRQVAVNGAVGLILHTAGEPKQWIKPLTELLATAAPDLRIYEIQSLREAHALSYWEVKWRAALVGCLGGLGIVLAAIGLYGVVAYAVSQRTREIGVRVALGASPGDVQWMVLGHGLRITAIGVAIGVALSAASVGLLRRYLYGLSPFDPVAFSGACLLWVMIAMLASWVPARRATRVDPLTALKWE